MTVMPERVVALDSPARPSRLTLVGTGDPTEQSCYVQGSFALAYTLPSGLLVEPTTPAAMSSTEDLDPDDIEAWAARFLQAVIETVCGDRPAAQMARWTSRPVFSDLVARQHRVSAQQSAQHSARPVRIVRHQVATVRTCPVAPGIVEVSGRVVTGRRSRALAARLEYVARPVDVHRAGVRLRGRA